MADVMMFPDTVEEFMEQYKIVDREHVYTNGTELVPIFRMEQWFAHKRGRWIEKTVKEGSPFLWRRFYCTACNDWTTHGKSKFCPNCGARMEASDD